MKPIDFLRKVWAIHCLPGDYVAVSAKKADRWRDWTFKYPDQLEDIETWLEDYDDNNLYFCPLPFSQPRRNEQYVARVGMLWSDVDEVTNIRVRPSVLWESSPGRFQALWILRQQIDRVQAKDLNKRLTYYIGADKGGWDMTQVLRIPGTRNFKYDPAPRVRLQHWESRTYGTDLVPARLLDKYRRTLPRKLVRLLESKAEVGKRSDVIWSLENQLREEGIDRRDVIGLIRESDWNKYRGRADEDERFKIELAKIDEEHGKSADEEDEPSGLKVTKYGTLMGSLASIPGWLVPGFWMRSSHGIVAGEPKSFKSTLALDLMFAVASGKPFLGQFPVEQQGSVLYIQNENADWIQRDRLEKLSKARGEVGKVKNYTDGSKAQIQFARELPIHFVNQQGFSMNDAAQKRDLEELLGDMKPVLVVFDPLYLMFEGDLASAKDLNPILNWLLAVKNDFNTSVMVIHHYNKGKDDTKRGGQRMLGSTTLHGWIESAWYLRVSTEEEAVGTDINKASASASVILEREFRGAGIYPRIDIKLKLGEFGDPAYSTEAAVHVPGTAETDEKEEEIITALERATAPMSERLISTTINLSRYQTKKLLEKMLKSGKIEREGERYKI